MKNDVMKWMDSQYRIDKVMRTIYKKKSEQKQ